MKMRVLSVLALLTTSLSAQVTFSRLVHADQEPQNWLTYGGTYASDRYSLLSQIDQKNVRNLQLKWVWRPTTSPADEKMENTPIVANGVLYATSLTSVVALDAATGRQYWKLERPFNPNDFRGQRIYLVNKGVAIEGNTLFWTTAWNDHLLSIDARTGRVGWEVEVVDWKKGYQLDVPPLVVKNLVILGTATNEMGANCFIAAYDIHTGKEVWKTYTNPNTANDPVAGTWAGDTWKHGGSPIWNGGSYDADTNLVFWGTGNPNPGWNASERRPSTQFDNLYSDSVMALDADTGKIKWHFQFTPGDEYDWDSTQIPVLADINWHGRPRKVMLWGNRNGFFYVLDRVSGQFLLGKAFTNQNWAFGIDQSGRPIKNPRYWPKPMGGIYVMPGSHGGTNYYPPSYDPQTGLFYMSVWDNFDALSAKQPLTPWKQGELYNGAPWWSGFAENGPPPDRPALIPPPPARGISRAVPPYRVPSEGYGAIRAIDPETGEKKWDFRMVNYTESGVLSTAGGLVFGGGMDGNFMALDAKSGRPLWHVYLGGPNASGPITYAVNGKQYIIGTGDDAMYAFSLPD